MNKEELKKIFENIQIGDVFKNIEIEGLNINDVNHVLNFLARKNNVQFEITTNYNNGKINFYYEVIKPSKKFLKGEKCASISKKAKEFLLELEK